MTDRKTGLFGRLVGRTAPVPEEAPVATEPKGWFKRLKAGLSRSSDALTGGITAIFTARKLDRDTIQELEDILIQADLGLETATRITDALAAGRFDKTISPEEVRAVLCEEIGKVLKPVALPLEIDATRKPHVVLMVGVNGSGKTTTIGKLAARLRGQGRSVMLAAGDTFRARPSISSRSGANGSAQPWSRARSAQMPRALPSTPCARPARPAPTCC